MSAGLFIINAGHRVLMQAAIDGRTGDAQAALIDHHRHTARFVQAPIPNGETTP